jgi:Arc/MetJ-type ribon-helix-helix transcriptional regulator
MSISLDRVNEERIQREINRGHFRDPQEVIARALDLLEAQEEWLLENKAEISRKIEASFEQMERGEYVSGAEARQLLAEHKQGKH